MNNFEFEQQCRDLDAGRVTNPLAAECLRRLRAVRDELDALSHDRAEAGKGDLLDALDNIADVLEGIS